MISIKNILTITALIFLLSCHKQESKIFIPQDIVIAHRGSTYWTPEETESAYRWARNIGADYLEIDLQRSKDGVLLALHDIHLMRTTDIEKVFPERKENAVSKFTYEELMMLDAGTWFNQEYPERAQKGYAPQSDNFVPVKKAAITFSKDGRIIVHPVYNQSAYINGKQYISTLEDVIRIAEGYCIAFDSIGHRLFVKEEIEGEIEYTFFYVKDPADIGHRPGVYIETKIPHLFPKIEEDLFQELDQLRWNTITQKVTDTISYANGKINMGRTSAKVILQTFSWESLEELNQVFKEKIPICLLLWLGDENMLTNDSLTMYSNIRKAQKFGAQIIGPSIGGPPNNYSDLLNTETFQWVNNEKLLIHPYSFDTDSQTAVYSQFCNGMFTNRAEMTIKFYEKEGKRPTVATKEAGQILIDLGY